MKQQLHRRYSGWVHGRRRGLLPLRFRLSPFRLAKRDLKIAKRAAAARAKHRHETERAARIFDALGLGGTQ